jgi:hypothetical protein
LQYAAASMAMQSFYLALAADPPDDNQHERSFDMSSTNFEDQLQFWFAQSPPPSMSFRWWKAIGPSA